MGTIQPADSQGWLHDPSAWLRNGTPIFSCPQSSQSFRPGLESEPSALQPSGLRPTPRASQDLQFADCRLGDSQPPSSHAPIPYNKCLLCVYIPGSLSLCVHYVTSVMSMGFSRQEYWSGLPCPSSRAIFLTQGSNPRLLCLLYWQAGRH